ncbi:MAG: DNA-binding protein [Candidatus Korarchaeota archaeon]|nr:DNA-binding protein [Thermoproteota archaeon]
MDTNLTFTEASSDSDFVLVLEKGDDVTESLKKLAKEENLSGFFMGIGAVADPTIGYFDVEKKQYLKMELKGSFEVLGLTGNISFLPDGEPFVHAHIILGDSNHKVLGGHLFSAKVSITLELLILRTQKLLREKNPEFDLWLISGAEE